MTKYLVHTAQGKEFILCEKHLLELFDSWQCALVEFNPDGPCAVCVGAVKPSKEVH